MATVDVYSFGSFGSLKGPSTALALHTKYAPAGETFLRCMAVAHGIDIPEPSDEPEKTVEAPAEEEETVDLADLDEDNYYSLLGLGHLQFKATQEQIKKAYRKVILKFHPDKMVKNDTDPEDDPIFLKISKAHSVLSDETKRRGYDSQLDFDDRIPKGTEEFGKIKGGFYGLYAPVFESNSRFSELKPVPTLGDSNTPHDDVTAFYDFWMRFKSWRDFSANDEHDASEADSRDERRWMQQENERGRKKLKREENERIRKLVDRAYSVDPRVAEIKRLAREEKKRRLEAKAAIRNAKVIEAAKKAEAEAAKKAAILEKEKAERAAEKAVRMREKKMRRKVRIGLNKLTDAAGVPDIDEDDLAFLLGRMGIKDCQQMLKDIADLPSAIVLSTAAKRLVEEQSKDAASAKAAEVIRLQKEVERVKQEAIRRAMKAIPWTESELSMLAKGLKKFPGGTRYRWKHIAAYINTLPDSNTRTPKDCISKTNSISSKTGGVKVDSSQAFKGFLDKNKAENSALWTVDQQKALQAGMKKFPSSMPKKERWTAIANAVPGKSLKDCIARVKAIRAKLQMRK